MYAHQSINKESEWDSDSKTKPKEDSFRLKISTKNELNYKSISNMTTIPIKKLDTVSLL